jgi:hypothetical protein
MAETLTLDTNAPKELISPDGDIQLSDEEKDSLAVGESLVNEQDQLLAGKYKNAEELEKAYVELQQKLGEKGTEDSKATGDTEEVSDESDEVSEEKEKNEETSRATSLLTEASSEFYSNDNNLSPETIEKFSEMTGAEVVNAYLESIKGQVPQGQPADLTEKDIDIVRDSVGGQETYDQIVNWASTNLDQNDVKSFDDLISTGNVGAIKLAVNGLKARYDNANGFEGEMLTGKPPKASGDVFRSQAELVAAMSDPRYDQDPAYRLDLIEKLDRSDLEF